MAVPRYRHAPTAAQIRATIIHTQFSNLERHA
jgi:hypothetical protein